MPEIGAFKTAARGGEYTDDQLVWRHIANELARLRATMHVASGGKRYDPPFLSSKAAQREEIEDAEAAEERREDFFAFADRTAEMIEA